MRVLIQRVKSASCCVKGETVSAIGPGLLLFVAVGQGDDASRAAKLAQKIVQLRIFEDSNEKMNLNIMQIQGELLLISQFTLYADLTRGNRPSFEPAADPKHAEQIIQEFYSRLVSHHVPVQQGVFGGHMEIKLTNDGPVTIWLDSDEKMK